MRWIAVMACVLLAGAAKAQDFCQSGSRVAWNLELTMDAQERPVAAVQRMTNARMAGASESVRRSVEVRMNEGRYDEARRGAVAMAEAVTGEPARTPDQAHSAILAACPVGQTIVIPARAVVLIARVCDLGRQSIAAGGSIICAVRPGG